MAFLINNGTTHSQQAGELPDFDEMSIVDTQLPWRILLFGGLRVERGEQSIVRFSNRKAAHLLAFLALEANSQDRDTLAARLWPDADSNTGRERLRQALASVRRELAPLGPAPLAGEGRSNLQLESSVRTDLKEFEASVRAARRAATDGERLNHLRNAVALATAPLLPDIDDPRVDSEREQIVVETIRLVRQAVTLLEERGDFDAALEVAYQGLEADPLREEAVQTLVELLCRLGQVEAARKQYQRLEEGLGALPGFKLPQAPSTPIAAPDRKRRARIPTPLTPIFGREMEISAVSRLLVEMRGRLVTLLGPGGVGKTRLAMEVGRNVADAFDGAVWFVPVVSVQRSEELLPALAAAVLGGEGGEQDIREALIRRLSNLPATLLILDNLEQVADNAAPVLRDLLEQIPSLSLLITSRQSLSIRGEMRFEVAPLSLIENDQVGSNSPAVRCFVHQAQSSNFAFQTTPENLSAIVQICRKLDGLPLALELAASWSPTLTPEQIVARLDEPLDLLVRRHSDGDTRHQTLRDAVATSYRMLSPELQDAFGMLAVFRGGWTLEAAEELLGPSGAMLLAELRDRSLVAVVEIREGDKSTMRYQLLETLREFADDILEGEWRELAQWRHARYYVDLLHEEHHALRLGRLDNRFNRIDREMGNISAAVEFALESEDSATFGLAVLALSDLFITWVRRSLNYLEPWLQRLRERLDRCPENLRGIALRIAAIYAPNEIAIPYLEEAVSHNLQMGDMYRAAEAMHDLSYRYEYGGDSKRALEIMRETERLFEQINDERGQNNARASIAGFLRDMGRMDEAVSLWEDLYQYNKTVGDDHTVAKVGLELALVAMDREEFAKAEQLAGESRMTFERRGEQWNIASALRSLGVIQKRQGKWEAAIQHLRQAAVVWEEAGYEGLGVECRNEVDAIEASKGKANGA